MKMPYKEKADETIAWFEFTITQLFSSLPTVSTVGVEYHKIYFYAICNFVLRPPLETVG
jgi:hypothetical protein